MIENILRAAACHIGLFVCSLALITTSLSAQNQLDNPDIERRIETLLQRMTLDEKVGQLVQCSYGAATGPGSACENIQGRIAKGQIGSLLNVTGAKDTNELQRLALEKSRLGIPLLFGLDVIHGYRTEFPVPIGMASTWDTDLVEKAARVAAKEATASGVRWTFSPMVDIARDARWGRIVEGAGEDPYLGSLFAAAYVRGYQGGKLDNPDSMAACLKHYVGYGASESGRDYNAVDMSEWRLRQVYLPPFESGVKAGAATVMSAFNSLSGVPASANPFTLTQVLRKEWQFRGFVVSDWNSVGELIPIGVANDEATATRKALTAGVDMDMQSGFYGKVLPDSVRTGVVSESVLNEAVRRVLRVKFGLGLFENPYTPTASPSKSLDPANVTLARTVAERSLVLLKNGAVKGAPVLPLSQNARTVALVGPLADSAVDMLGSWGAKSEPGDVVTLRAALAERIQKKGGRLSYAKGADIRGNDESGFADALDAARQSDVVIAALGEEGVNTGEATSRASLDLPGNQQKFLEQLAATGKPVVLVLFNGRPLALKWAAAHVPAIVEAWYPGIQAGPALANVLFGDANFSGKLTLSVPRSVGQEPLYYNQLNSGRPAGDIDLSRAPANSDEKFVSRYLDEQNSALFPFGYGLSYTRFSYSSPELSAKTASTAALNSGTGAVQVSATITNSGSREGREIVQLYIGQRGTSMVLPVKELKGYKLVELAPGQSQKVEFTIAREQLAFWTSNMRHEVEPAEVTVWVAPNSAEGKSVQFTITK